MEHDWHKNAPTPNIIESIINKLFQPINSNHPLVVITYVFGNWDYFFILCTPNYVHMVIVSMVDPRIPLDPRYCLFFGIQWCDHCDNIVINPFLDMKVYFIVDPMKSVELFVRDVLGLLLWLPSYLPFSNNNHNTKFPCSNQDPKRG